MNFNNVIGQKEVIKGLTNSIKCGRVGHAYIFSGPKGIGKRMMAEIFAGILLCDEHENGESCGKCISCRMYENKSNPDFYMVGQGETGIGVDEIRKLQSDIIIRPLYSGRKVYLILNAENMTVQAQNCLLKILEEPPHYAVIILTTSNYNALMETIKSRALRYSFRKNTFDEVKAALGRECGKSGQEAVFLASYADGVIGTALELSDSEDFAMLREKTIEIMQKTVRKAKLSNIFDMYDFFEANKGSIDIILDIMILFYRDILVLKKVGKENILINSDKKDIILNNASAFTVQKLVKNIEEVETVRKNIKQNANFQLAIEVMLMRLQEESYKW